jgi:hypothetical protein
MNKNNASFITPILILFLALIFGPLVHLDGLNRIPGDLGDSRLLNYFLENIFKYFTGSTDSLWHLSFFYPFPYIIGFSENLFGSAPIYIIVRLIGFNTDTSFQLWFLFGYVANFIAAYYALRRLNGSVIASSIGALIFAFALPTVAHAGHAQLHYRFGLPLAVLFFVDFLNTKSWRSFLIAGSWLVWQFYAGVYIGFFTLLLLMTMSLTYLGYDFIKVETSIKRNFSAFFLSWRAQSTFQIIVFFGISLLLLLLLFILFYPYLQVVDLYGTKRSWSEIATMLPRPQSYFLSDASFLWSNVNNKLFSSLPMRHEHQMFIGAIPLILALAGFFIGGRWENGPTFTLMSGMIGIAIILTLYVGGYSLWYLLHNLPLFSAMRAMTRIDQVFLFPIAYFAVIAIDKIRASYAWGSKVIVVMILPLLISEMAMTTMPTSEKNLWRQKFSSLETTIPKNLPNNSILFFAQKSDLPYADELDAMWVSLHHNKKTINGYSGSFPPNFDYKFGSDCVQVPKRVISYLKFIEKSDSISDYRDLMSRITPIGFNDCDPSWKQTPPNIVNRSYSADEFNKLSLGAGEVIKNGNHHILSIVISNSLNYSFIANSGVGKPIRISWRYIDMQGQPLSNWENRRNLPSDIPAEGSLKVIAALDPHKLKVASAVEVSIVQELVFWGHDIGIQPVKIPLKKGNL